jgi:hypothetical protein
VVKKYLDSGGIAANSRSYSYSEEVMGAVKGLAQSVCNSSADPHIYDKLLAPRFWDRYDVMKANPEKCCRPSRGNSQRKRNTNMKEDKKNPTTTTNKNINSGIFPDEWITNFLSQEGFG